MPVVTGLDFIEVGPLPDGFDAQAASSGWLIGIANGGKSVEIRSADGEEVLHTYTAPVGYDVDRVFLEEPHVAIVLTKQDESADDRLVVLDVNTFKERELGKGAPPPTRGSWAAGSNKIAYGSDRGEDYCLAVVDLQTLRGALHECVPPRNGIHQVKISPYGLGYNTFDDQQPASCGTARIELPDEDPQTVALKKKCAAWDTAVVTDEAVVWSEVPKKNAIDFANFYARVGGGETELLGEGTTGSLVWCGEAAWYINQAESQLMRWTPEDGLQLAYEVPYPEKSLVGAPTCSSGALWIPAMFDVDDHDNEVVVRANVVN